MNFIIQSVVGRATGWDWVLKKSPGSLLFSLFSSCFYCRSWVASSLQSFYPIMMNRNNYGCTCLHLSAQERASHLHRGSTAMNTTSNLESKGMHGGVPEWQNSFCDSSSFHWWRNLVSSKCVLVIPDMNSDGKETVAAIHQTHLQILP